MYERVNEKIKKGKTREKSCSLCQAIAALVGLVAPLVKFEIFFLILL